MMMHPDRIVLEYYSKGQDECRPTSFDHAGVASYRALVSSVYFIVFGQIDM